MGRRAQVGVGLARVACGRGPNTPWVTGRHPGRPADVAPGTFPGPHGVVREDQRVGKRVLGALGGLGPTEGATLYPGFRSDSRGGSGSWGTRSGGPRPPRRRPPSVQEAVAVSRTRGCARSLTDTHGPGACTPCHPRASVPGWPAARVVLSVGLSSYPASWGLSQVRSCGSQRFRRGFRLPRSLPAPHVSTVPTRSAPRSCRDGSSRTHNAPCRHKTSWGHEVRHQHSPQTQARGPGVGGWSILGG